MGPQVRAASNSPDGAVDGCTDHTPPPREHDSKAESNITIRMLAVKKKLPGSCLRAQKRKTRSNTLRPGQYTRDQTYAEGKYMAVLRR